MSQMNLLILMCLSSLSHCGLIFDLDSGNGALELISTKRKKKAGSEFVNPPLHPPLTYEDKSTATTRFELEVDTCASL